MGKKSLLKGAPLKQERIVSTIRESILNGNLKPGERLAPLNDLSEKLKVSPSVVYRALQQLVDDEMIESRGIRGFYVKGYTDMKGSAPVQTKRKQTKKSLIFLTANHHSDLTWKRSYKDYRKIRDAQLNMIAGFFRQSETFCMFMEQEEVLQEYLEDHPENIELFRKMVKDNRLTLSLNNSIPDTNMICGEQLVRDIQRGAEFCRTMFGIQPEIACYNDAFGENAQLPQILKQFGVKFMRCGRLPNLPQELQKNKPFRWFGQDESSVIAYTASAGVDFLALLCNAPFVRTPKSRLYENLHNLRNMDLDGDVLASYGTETKTLMPEIFPLIEKVNREPGKNLIQFRSVKSFCDRIDTGSLQEMHGEINPIFTGCYTTRIKVKQEVRKTENLLFAAELLTAIQKKNTDLSEAWHQLTMACFHDGMCGCHHDVCNIDVMNKLKFAQDQAMQVLKESAPAAGLAVLNPGPGSATFVELPKGKNLPSGIPLQKINENRYCFISDMPSNGLVTFKTGSNAIVSPKVCKPVFRTKYFEVDFSTPYPKIKDLKNGTDVFPDTGFGEIMFRHDPGSMWSELYGGDYFGREYQKEKVLSCKEGPVFFEVITGGENLPFEASDCSGYDYWHGFKSLKYQKVWRFYRELDYFTLNLKLDWQGENTKISIRFPVKIDVANAEGTFDIPFGAIVRKPYYEVPESYKSTLKMLTDPADYQHAGGDWPALNWVNYCDHTEGLSVANTGTPAHQCVGGYVYTSLIRSGTQIADGFMRPQQGALSNGSHEFEFAFRPHKSEDVLNAANLGAVLNRKPILLHDGTSAKAASVSAFPNPPQNLRISSIRQTKEGMIVRMYETAGLQTTFHLPGKAIELDLHEKPISKAAGKAVFNPFSIKTFLFR